MGRRRRHRDPARYQPAGHREPCPTVRLGTGLLPVAVRPHGSRGLGRGLFRPQRWSAGDHGGCRDDRFRVHATLPGRPSTLPARVLVGSPQCSASARVSPLGRLVRHGPRRDTEASRPAPGICRPRWPRERRCLLWSRRSRGRSDASAPEGDSSMVGRTSRGGGGAFGAPPFLRRVARRDQRARGPGSRGHPWRAELHAARMLRFGGKGQVRVSTNRSSRLPR